MPCQFIRSRLTSLTNLGVVSYIIDWSSIDRLRDLDYSNNRKKEFPVLLRTENQMHFQKKKKLGHLC